MGLTGELGKDYTLGHDYTYINCIATKGKKKKYKAGEFIVIVPTVTVNPVKCKLLIVPNQQLAALGAVSYQPLLESSDYNKLGFSIKLEKDCDLAKIDWICRILVIL